MEADPLQPQRCAKLLSALAQPERLRIVRLLRGGPRNAGEIAELLAIPAVNVSHHMNVLKGVGLVQGEKHGRFMRYSLAPGVLQTEPEGDCLDLGCCRLEMPPAPEDLSS